MVEVEIEERDHSSLHHAIDLLRDYSKLTVEVKLEPNAAELPIVEGKRMVHTKEIITEQLKEKWGCMMIEGSAHMGFQMQNGLPSVIS